MVSLSDGVKTFVLDGGKNSVQDVLAKLKFIAKIGSDDVMDVTSLTISKRGWFTSISRTIASLAGRKESRDETLEFVRITFADAFELAVKYRQTTDPFGIAISDKLIEAMKDSNVGINSLKTGYGHDKMFVSRLETFVTVSDAQIEGLLRAQSKTVEKTIEKVLSQGPQGVPPSK